MTLEVPTHDDGLHKIPTVESSLEEEGVLYVGGVYHVLNPNGICLVTKEANEEETYDIKLGVELPPGSTNVQVLFRPQPVEITSDYYGVLKYTGRSSAFEDGAGGSVFSARKYYTVTYTTAEGISHSISLCNRTCTIPDTDKSVLLSIEPDGVCAYPLGVPIENVVLFMKSLRPTYE